MWGVNLGRCVGVGLLWQSLNMACVASIPPYLVVRYTGIAKPSSLVLASVSVLS